MSPLVASTRIYQRSGDNPLIAGLIQGFRPRRRLTLSQFAEKRIVLSPERSASPGPFRIGDAVYQRGMMDAITDPDVEEAVFLTSSQVGKTSILTAIQGYYAMQEPSPQLSVFPTQIVADAYCEEQFDPTIKDSPKLAALFRGYDYPGGYIAFVGANIPSQLAMRPIRVVTGDEVDRWPASSGKEGSPIDLATTRTKTFENRKIILASTPLLTKTSMIVERFRTSKQHFFFVCCHECETAQVLKWERVRFDKHREDKATYACEGCGVLWTNAQKRRNVRDAEKRGGGWRRVRDMSFFDGYFKSLKPKGVTEEGRVGFYISELYSPFSTLAKMAQAWGEAEGDPTKEQAFRNTREGMPWDGEVSSVADADMLKQRREEYSPRVVPKRAGLVTASVDVQDDRLELLTMAWGVGDEAWLLERIVINSDPSVNATWDILAENLLRRYPHEGGHGTLGIEAVAVDSGGHFTQMVYKFCARHQRVGRLWYAIKGVPGQGKLAWAQSKQKLRDNTKLFLVGVDDMKTTVYARYGIQKVGPGYVHIHSGINDDLINQMTAEHAVVEYNAHGFPVRNWERIRPRNEMLDLLVYNNAVRSSINIDMNVRLMRMTAPSAKALDATQIGALFKQ